MRVHANRDSALVLAAQASKAVPKITTIPELKGIHMEADARLATMTFFECCETVRRDGLQLIHPRRGATGQYDLKPPDTGPSGEWVFLDAVTANLVCQLCAALPVSRQEGFKRLPAGKILTLCRRAADGA